MYKIPDDVWRMVVEFATHTLSQVLTLQQIDSHFRRLMLNPIMVTHISIQLDDLHAINNMGSWRFGVHYFKCMELPAIAPLGLLAHLPAVRCLDLSCGKFDSENFQVAIMSLHNLQRLDLSFCRQLTQLSNLPTTLRELDVMCCTRLVSIPPMPNLERLEASNCLRLVTLPDLPALLHVDLGYSSTVIDSALDSMGSLRHLKIGHDTAPDPQRLTNLDSLCLVDCNFEREWVCAPLTNLTSLTLVFVSYRRDHDLTCLSTLTALRRLHLETGVSDDNLTPLEQLVNLKHLVLASELISDDGLVSVGKMSSLETLYINNCRRLQITGEGLLALVPLIRLRSLHLSECYGVSYQGLSVLTQLRTLCIDNDVNLNDRWPITLEEEWIDQMVRQDDLQPLTLLHNLTTLELLYCRVKSLRWLNQIPRLAVLVVKGCHLTRRGLWDLTPCHTPSVILGECSRAKLGKDVGRFLKCIPHLTFECENES